MFFFLFNAFAIPIMSRNFYISSLLSYVYFAIAYCYSYVYFAIVYCLRFCGSNLLVKRSFPYTNVQFYRKLHRNECEATTVANTKS